MLALVLRGAWEAKAARFDLLPGDEWTALSLFFSLLQAWVPAPSYQTAFNPPAWSLSVEMFFYATLPFLLLLSTRRLLFVVGPLCIVLAAGSAGMMESLPWFQGKGMSTAVKCFPPVRLTEFLLGVILARVFQFTRSPPRFASPLHPSLLVCVALASLFLFPILGDIPKNLLKSLRSDGADSFLFHISGAPFFALFILCLATADCHTPKPWVLRLLASRPLQLLGNASFAMYLLHIPLRIMLGTALFRSAWGFFIYLALVHVVSILSYLWLEKPAQRFLNNWYKRRKPRPREN